MSNFSWQGAGHGPWREAIMERREAVESDGEAEWIETLQPDYRPPEDETPPSEATNE